MEGGLQELPLGDASARQRTGLAMSVFVETICRKNRTL
jgi:hypothetical protein